MYGYPRLGTGRYIIIPNDLDLLLMIKNKNRLIFISTLVLTGILLVFLAKHLYFAYRINSITTCEITSCAVPGQGGSYHLTVGGEDLPKLIEIYKRVLKLKDRNGRYAPWNSHAIAPEIDLNYKDQNGNLLFWFGICLTTPRMGIDKSYVFTIPDEDYSEIDGIIQDLIRKANKVEQK